MRNGSESAALMARYASNAAIIGGSTVFLVVLLGSINLDRRTIASLCFAFAGAFLLALFMRIQAGSERWDFVRVKLGSFIAFSAFAVVVAAYGLFMLDGAIQNRSPVEVFTSEWWVFAVIGLLTALMGAVQRAEIETTL